MLLTGCTLRSLWKLSGRARNVLENGDRHFAFEVAGVHETVRVESKLIRDRRVAYDVHDTIQ